MDDVQLHSRIAADFAELTLDRPVAGIISRGRRQRRRRQRLPLLGVLTLGAIAAMVTVQSSANHGQAFAAWTSHAQTTDSRTATAINRSCRDSASTPAALPLRVLDRRGDFALSIYTDGQSITVCNRFRGDAEQFFTQGSSTEPGPVTQAKTLALSHPVAFEGSGTTFLRNEGSASSAYGWIGPAVTTVVIDSGGYTTTATLSDGLFSAWWPGNANGTTTTVSCTAYDSNGQVIGRDILNAG